MFLHPFGKYQISIVYISVRFRRVYTFSHKKTGLALFAPSAKDILKIRLENEQRTPSVSFHPLVRGCRVKKGKKNLMKLAWNKENERDRRIAVCVFE